MSQLKRENGELPPTACGLAEAALTRVWSNSSRDEKGANVSTCVDQAGGFSHAQARCPVSPFAPRFGSFSHSRGWVGVRERKTIDFSVY